MVGMEGVEDVSSSFNGGGSGACASQTHATLGICPACDYAVESSDMGGERLGIAVEVCQKEESRATALEARRHVLFSLFCLSPGDDGAACGSFSLEKQIRIAFASKNELASLALSACASMRNEDSRQLSEFRDDAFLAKNIAFIRISSERQAPRATHAGSVAVFGDRIVDFRTYVYQLNDDGPADEMTMTLDENGGESADESMTAASHWLLPAADFEGIWESLMYDDPEVKNALLRYASTAILFSDKRVDPNVISWNGVVLLHGPPGTGKTSLCKALAQKLSVRMAHRYTHGELVEINSHSLFSRWFSESGKLVMKMFQRIQAFVDDPSALVFVLIDEVESLTAARKAASSGAEPSDAIRVVNAVLTQIDALKKHKNVIILATSNVTGSIDCAFIDRADIKQYIGPPSFRAIYEMIRTCLLELMRVGIIVPEHVIVDLNTLELMGFPDNESNRAAKKLYEISKKSEGLSGRSLKKVPFLAHALFLGKSTANIDEFLSAVEKATARQLSDREELSK